MTSLGINLKIKLESTQDNGFFPESFQKLTLGALPTPSSGSCHSLHFMPFEWWFSQQILVQSLFSTISGLDTRVTAKGKMVKVSQLTDIEQSVWTVHKIITKTLIHLPIYSVVWKVTKFQTMISKAKLEQKTTKTKTEEVVVVLPWSLVNSFSVQQYWC